MTKREQVLQTTLELITELGFHATPMALIIEKSNVAAGTIYYHFKSKEDLIDTLYNDIKKEMAVILINGIELEPNYKSKFILIWRNLFNFFINNPSKFEFLQQYSHSPLIRKEIKELNQIHYQAVLEYFNSGIRLGIIKDLPAILLLNLVIDSIATLVKLIFSDEIILSNEILEHIIQSSWDSIKIN